ncbi:MAG: hypothetical protein NC210_07600 [[Clostridium] fimetarium]|nr:hypothetical protein [Alistipes timonensis]MCM1406271.1 hypothetical protein [[Clostridium] fimetarium]
MTSYSTAELRRGGKVVGELRAPRPAGATFESDAPLLPFLYRLEAASDSAPAKWRPYTPYALFINPLPTERGAALLEAATRNGLPVPPELSRYSWPVVRGNAQWLMAAAETAVAGGDERWSRQVLSSARQILELDTRMALDRGLGLFKGVPRYLANPGSRFPDWMGPVELYQALTLAENAAYHAALLRLEQIASASGRESGIAYPAAALREAVNRELWNPRTGRYGALLYGNPAFPVRLQGADNAAQAVAILGGTASEAMAASIAANTPAAPFGPTTLSPAWPGDSVSATEMPPTLQRVMWMAAMAATGNETAYSAAASALIAGRARELLDQVPGSAPRPGGEAARPVASLILRGFLGAKFTPEGLYLNPAVPSWLPADKTIRGLRYRGATLDITITGTGRALATFTIDGKPATPFIPAGLTGRHEIAITLAGAAADPGKVAEAEGETVLPPTPKADWTSRLKARLAMPGDNVADAFEIYVDGVLEQVSINPDYTVAAPRRLTAAQFAAAGEGVPGFATSPHIIAPRGWETIIKASDIARAGTRLISDKSTAARVVESNRWKNRSVSFDFDAPAAGRYLVDVRYSGGLGIVNPHRRTALRRLKVNNVEAGILVFPQFSPAWWNRDTGTDWQLPSTYSSQLAIELPAGTNRLELLYFQPSPVYIDPLANTLLFDAVRIRRLE